MNIAAIKSGTDPVVPLPRATFHRTLEEPVGCPKCDVSYLLVADYDWAVTRHFADDSRRHTAMLRKAIFLEHGAGHPTTHFETNGVVVSRHSPAQQTPGVQAMRPLTKLVN